MIAYRPIALLVLIMAAVAAATTGIGLAILYEAAFEEEKARLSDTVMSQAHLIRAVARYDATAHESGEKSGATQATIFQIKDAYSKYKGLGHGGEFALARREGDKIVFLVQQRHGDLEKPPPVSLESGLAEPMRRALSGESGTLVGLDYRGKMVMAAYEPVVELNLGIVAKIDLAEIRAPFIRAGISTGAIAIVIVAMGAGIFIWVGNPMVRRIQQSEERFRLSFENTSEGNVIIDGNGIIEIFNKASEKIFGYAADEVIGQNVNILMPETDRSAHNGYIKNFLKTGEGKIICIGREVRGLRKNGEEFSMHLGIGDMSIAGEVAFIGSITDLTERKSLEKQLAQAHRMEALGQLTGGIAHDFNNLLQSVNLNAGMLKARVGEDEASEHLAEAIEKAVSRGASLTNRLLTFSRQQALSPVAADVAELIDGLREMLQRTLGATIDLRIETASDRWPAMIDPHQFENALVNLAINARDAMATGGKLTIETTNATLDETYAEQHGDVTAGDYVLVSVSDSGTGMSREVLDKAFEPFFTTKEVGAGSGLGLSMVYGFTKQSNGHIAIYSEVGRGTTVKLYVPRSEETPAKTDATDDTREPARGRERILVVEDDENVREAATTILRDHGYDIVEAGNGGEAIKHMMEGKAFDLLFTDLVLPGGMDGVEIATEAKNLQPNLKVLYTTVYAENAVVRNGDLEPGVSLINKPYRREELLERVRAVLYHTSILIVDDDEELRATLEKGLARSGYSVTTASGGIEGLKLIESQRFDVVVMDLIMRDGEGMETLGWIKESNPETPVIGISGYPQYLEGFRKLGGAATLKKPFGIDELIGIIAEVTCPADGAK